MANWQSKIDLEPIWSLGESGELPPPELGKATAGIIRKSSAWARFLDSELEDIADDFEHVATVDEFDKALERLYDWGDEALDDHWAGKKRCWINK